MAQTQVAPGCQSFHIGLLPRQNFLPSSCLAAFHAPSILWDAGNSSRRALKSRSSSLPGGKEAGQVGSFPDSPSKSVSISGIPLCCHPQSPAPPGDPLGSVGPGDPGDLRDGGGVSIAVVIFRPSRAPESAELVGMEGEGTGNDNGSWHLGCLSLTGSSAHPQPSLLGESGASWELRAKSLWDQRRP